MFQTTNQMMFEIVNGLEDSPLAINRCVVELSSHAADLRFIQGNASATSDYQRLYATKHKKCCGFQPSQ